MGNKPSSRRNSPILSGKDVFKNFIKESKRNKNINDEQHQAKKKDAQIHKLLLLGPGESGKSTLFKQILHLYVKDAYAEHKRTEFKPIIERNTIKAMQKLIKQSKRFSNHDIDSNIECIDECEMEEKTQEVAEHILELKFDAHISKEVADEIKTLWADHGIQSTFEHRASFQFPDSGSYFIARCSEFCKKDYVPSYDDVLHARRKTTQIKEASFDIFGKQFKIMDVGGQRSQRRKWIHCFEDVTSVIFVAAISEYDQHLYEDETTNRVHESLDLFADISNSKWFKNTPIILFLNKKDLFAEKIKKVPLSVCFDDYKGPDNDYDAGCKFIQQKFESKSMNKEKHFYTHFTCATDTENIETVFNNVKDIVLKTTLHASGFL